MEVRCVRCANKDICDYVGDWVLDEDGARIAANDVEDCPEYDIARDKVCEEMLARIMDIDPTDFQIVKVTEGKAAVGSNIPLGTPVFVISSVTNKNHNPVDKIKMAGEVTDVLQELNDDELNIEDAEFIVNIIYMESDHASEKELDHILDVESTGLASGMKPEMDMDPSLAKFKYPPRECPICNTKMSKTCEQCGYEEEEMDESWRESI